MPNTTNTSKGRLQDKVAVITGVSAPLGLGMSFAKRFAEEGAKLVISDVNEKGTADRAQELKSSGAQVISVKCDISSPESVKAMFAAAVKEFGTVDILINNAGLIPTKSPEQEARRNKHYAYFTTPMPRQSLGITSSIDDGEWLKWWGVNIHGQFWCIREALKFMEPKRYGRIVNIASTGGISVMSGHSQGYSASKAALVNLTKTVALDVAGANIFVNCIAPGGIATAEFEAYLEKLGADGRAKFFQLIPAGRLGTGGEYAALAVHLASDETYCVGQIISPNGGLVF